MNYDSYNRRFRATYEKAEVPENKTRPCNFRHTRLTEVAIFMGYEQLNKFAGWKSGSDRAKVYVHLNNDDMNKALREEDGISNGDDGEESWNCGLCSTENKDGLTECRNCGRPRSLEQRAQRERKLEVLERLSELAEEGVLEKLDCLEE